MKPNASVLAVAGAISLAALASMTVACSPSSSPALPEASTTDASPSASQTSISPAPASSVPVTRTAQKQTEAPSEKPSPIATSRTVESCVIRMALINDPNPPLNVRSAPTTDGDNVVGQLKNGTLVTVANDQNGWLQIKTPLKGWVSKQQTATGCNEKVERLSLSANGATVQVSDRFIGTGNHRYVVSGSKGQTLTIARDRGPFPAVIAPDGTILLGHDANEKRSNWSAQLAQTGDYVFELDSNFRGYKYSFSVETK